MRQRRDIGYEDLTDEYVSENFGTQGISTIDELKSQVSSGLEQQVYSKKMQEVQTEVLAKLLDECEVTIPDGLLDQRIAEYKRARQQDGTRTAEQSFEGLYW